jgi:hypothetical protein
VFGLIEAHRKAGRDHEAALDEQERLERIGDKAADWVGEATCHAEFNALDVLLAAAATTLPGIVAKLAYDIAKRDTWMFDDRTGSATRLIEGCGIHRKRLGGAVMNKKTTTLEELRSALSDLENPILRVGWMAFAIKCMAESKGLDDAFANAKRSQPRDRLRAVFIWRFRN